MLVSGEVTQGEIERILHSETFRNSDVLRRLLCFLADRTISGEADQLKEYTIGIDALGKPPSYDPRQDAVVRIQAGRLRQKLAEYYRAEGKDDPLIVDVPKGHFKLSFEPRPKPPTVEHDEPAPVVAVDVRAKTFNWRHLAMAFGAALAVALVWGIYGSVQLARERTANAALGTAWTPELNELWGPLLATNRPLIVSVAAPLFVGFETEGSFRDPSLDHWNDVQQSPRISTIRQALNNTDIVPRHNYITTETMLSTFHLGRLLAVSSVNVSVVRSDQLSWQQLANNNVLLVGAPKYVEHLKALPVELDIVLEASGVRMLRPRPGEPAHLQDHYTRIGARDTFRVPDDGEVHALVTRTPGPLGKGDVQSFSSNQGPGTLAAVQWFTDPNPARILVGKLRKPNGELPRYFQIVLKVQYKDAVPTEVSYVLHRELRAERRAAN